MATLDDIARELGISKSTVSKALNGAKDVSKAMKALLKEYKKNHPNMATVVPHIIVEIDPNVYPSPSLRGYIEKETLRPMDDVYKALSDGKTYVSRHAKDQYLKYTYVRRLEYRSSSKDSDWARQDMRMFGAGTLARTMADELKQAGIATGITDDGIIIIAGEARHFHAVIHQLTVRLVGNNINITTELI